MKGQVSISIDDYNELVEAKKVLLDFDKLENIALVEVYELHKQVEFKAIKESEAVELFVIQNKNFKSEIERYSNEVEILKNKIENIDSQNSEKVFKAVVITSIIMLVGFVLIYFLKIT